MNPEEKAEELIEKFKEELPFAEQLAKQCALIAVDEIIDLADRASDYDGNMWRVLPDFILTREVDKEHQYWQQVKESIQKL